MLFEKTNPIIHGSVVLLQNAKLKQNSDHFSIFDL